MNRIAVVGSWLQVIGSVLFMLWSLGETIFLFCNGYSMFPIVIFALIFLGSICLVELSVKELKTIKYYFKKGEDYKKSSGL